ncbi:MAG: TonB-dependent receptor [Ferruginibacter sp.]|nr:TonB-dependent receptor [Cytophagales bacterium]
MNRIVQIGLCLLTILAGHAQAQDETITGRVTSAEDGAALPGVNVSVKGTSSGTATGADGVYRLNVPTNATLVFSFIGLVSQEIAVGSRTAIDVQLASNVRLLSEAVIIGYGAAVSKKEATGATSNVRGDAITNLPLQSFDRAMQGRVAGVQISSANGTPGGAVSVRIRGVGSITAGTQPLYIVDGVQLNNRSDGGATANTNPLAFLNPNDIESIDILKDAATAAIYGAQAANGVVLITTKKGKAGRTQVGFNAYTGITEPIRTLAVMNTQEFISTRIEASSTNRPTIPAETIRGNVLAELGFNRDLSDAEIAALPTYDWQKEAYKTGIVQNYEVTAQGGTDKTTFYSSLSYNKQDASLINVDFRRVAARISLTNKINDRITTETSLNLSSITQRGPYGGAGGSLAFGAPQYSAPLILPFNPITNPDGSFYGLPASGVVMPGDLSQNVIANANFIKSSVVSNQAVGNLTVTYKINDHLFVRGLGGIDFRSLKGSFYGDPRLSDYFAIRGTLTNFLSDNLNYNTNVTLNFSKSLNKHSLSGLGGVEYRSDVNEGTSLNAQGFPSPDFTTANAAAEPSSVGGFWTGVKRAAVFGNLRYDYDKKYLFSAVLRYDGSSRFGANNQWGLFPSLSAKWLLSEEAFLKASPVVSDLGLRASVGSTGNDQIDNFASRRLYGLNGVYQGNSGTGPSLLGNSNLRWERNVTYNVGLDYGFFGGRIKGAVDVFRRISRDLLLDRSIPATNGFTNAQNNTTSFITENIGEVINEGIEWEVTTVNLDRGNRFRWETSFNVSAIRNEVTKLSEGVDVLPGDLTVRVGYPLFTNVAVPFAGVNPANGRPMWYDPNGNLTYLVRTADQRPLGHNDLSKYFGGLTNTFTMGGLELSVFFQYDYGRTAYNGQEFRLADNAGVLRNGLTYYRDNRWTTPGQITAVPRPAENRTELSGRVSSYQTAGRFYQDASYIRLKQLTLAYKLPKSLLESGKISGVRIYAQAINLLTWTEWTGFDPEFLSLGGNGNQGIVPTSRNYTFGIQVQL